MGTGNRQAKKGLSVKKQRSCTIDGYSPLLIGVLVAAGGDLHGKALLAGMVALLLVILLLLQHILLLLALPLLCTLLAQHTGTSVSPCAFGASRCCLGSIMSTSSNAERSYMLPYGCKGHVRTLNTIQ